MTFSRKLKRQNFKWMANLIRRHVEEFFFTLFLSRLAFKFQKHANKISSKTINAVSKIAEIYADFRSVEIDLKSTKNSAVFDSALIDVE